MLKRYAVAWCYKGCPMNIVLVYASTGLDACKSALGIVSTDGSLFGISTLEKFEQDLAIYENVTVTALEIPDKGLAERYDQ